MGGRGSSSIMNLKFCTSVAKRLKLKVRKFLGPNPTFVEVTGEKLVGQARNQEFFRAGELGHLHKDSPITQEKPGREKITNFFSWVLLKIAF